MEIILLERIAKLGQMGDVVNVKQGYARNFLLPQGKALRATEANRKSFEHRRVELEARNLELRKEATGVQANLEGRELVLVRSASDTGSLYGSVTKQDVAKAANEDGVNLARQQIELDRPIKELGRHEVSVALHPEVSTTIAVIVARSLEEAKAYREPDEAEANQEETDQALADETQIEPDQSDSHD